MRKLYLFLIPLVSACQPATITESERLSSIAQKVEIIRDSYGVAHIYADTDANAVFGMLYAQCEDDFHRVEMNYINAMGRLAEVEGKQEIWRDLRMKLFIDPEEMKSLYSASPDWMKSLMDGFADGINYYLQTHPEVSPELIDHFEPWMALTFSEGSIGGDIESINLRQLGDFYGFDQDIQVFNYNSREIADGEPRGSNGISIAPGLTENGNALFLINPHTSFFFRSELHVNSGEGLNAYGATTWGQFFIYQGFNERLGWMHTSSEADVIDLYRETVLERDGKYYYLHDEEEKPVTVKDIILPFRTDEGMDSITVQAFFTHHGPVIRRENGHWISVALMNRPLDALTQSFRRTKAADYDDFLEVMDIRTNSSNNTVYADADGNIAYFHGNYMPRREPTFDWSGVVDGSDPRTDYRGLHDLNELIIIRNPGSGWLQNCNSTPFTAAGEFSPRKEDYPAYMAPDEENFRGIHAIRVLEGKKGWNMDKLRDAAYDPYLPGLADIVPALINAYARIGERYRGTLNEPMQALVKWNFEASESSTPTTLATFWGNDVVRQAFRVNRGGLSPYEWIRQEAPDTLLLNSLGTVVDQLENDFGCWAVPWGEVNRYQRTTGDIAQDFSDEKPSLPVGFQSSRWGSLASFGARKYPGTKKMYGTSGNSFVAIVEFGDKLKAMSVSTGGGSGDPGSPHFDDQAVMYTKGEFKPVRYYREDVIAHMEATYHPGER